MAGLGLGSGAETETVPPCGSAPEGVPRSEDAGRSCCMPYLSRQWPPVQEVRSERIKGHSENVMPTHGHYNIK